MWDDGVLAVGSSGSPLLDADTGRVVGVLTGGTSACTGAGKQDEKGSDIFGKLFTVIKDDHFVWLAGRRAATRQPWTLEPVP